MTEGNSVVCAVCPVVILNGASSAGKTALAKALQAMSPHLWVRLSIDDFLNMLPGRCGVQSVRMADQLPETALVRGFHRTISSMARAGNRVIVDHVLGDRNEWVLDCLTALYGLPVVLVGVHCRRSELLRRELARTDRRPAPDLADDQHACIHRHMVYDIEIDTTSTCPSDCAARLQAYLAERPSPVAFGILSARHLTDGLAGCARVCADHQPSNDAREETGT